MTRWLLCLSALASATGFAADSGGACKAPAATNSNASLVDVRDYRSETDTTKELKLAAFKRDSDAYNAQIVESLESSTDPRDWAIAALSFRTASDADGGTRLSELKRAVKAAPDDVLVLWMATAVARTDSDGVFSKDVVEKLKSAEPDNGAVWLEAITNAAVLHDHDGVSAALKRMSATSRVNNHFAELSDAIMAVYRRFPMPDSLYDEAPDDWKSMPKDGMPLAYATVVTSAFALPAFQHLVNACRTDVSGRNADRSADCQGIGRMLETNSDTLVGAAIGVAMLRVSRTYGDEDVAFSRELSWTRQQFVKHDQSRNTPYNQDDALFHEDWAESNSELVAMRKQLERAAIPTTPPDDWKDTESRFSAELLTLDTDYFAQHTVAY